MIPVAVQLVVALLTLPLAIASGGRAADTRQKTDGRIERVFPRCL